MSAGKRRKLCGAMTAAPLLRLGAVVLRAAGGQGGSWVLHLKGLGLFPQSTFPNRKMGRGKQRVQPVCGEFCRRDLNSGNTNGLSNFLKPFPAPVSSSIWFRGFQTICKTFLHLELLLQPADLHCLNCRGLYSSYHEVISVCDGFGYIIANNTV